MNYNVTYPGGKTVQMHNSHPKSFERALNRGLKDGVIISWQKATQPTLFDSIRSGSIVTFLTPQNQTRKGRAVMRGPYGWVLNCGGRHGTPAVVDERNVVAVKEQRQ